jgi:cellulose synthase/poly-beta-1,6-N-acetylglucosamine synthase-like glycosyltransferase
MKKKSVKKLIFIIIGLFSLLIGTSLLIDKVDLAYIIHTSKWYLIFTGLLFFLLAITSVSSPDFTRGGVRLKFNDEKREQWYEFLFYAIISGIFFVLILKLFFASFDSAMLYIYGILVTLVLFINFFIAFFKYEDPAVIASEKEKKNNNKKDQPLVSCLVAVWNEEDDIEECIQSLVNQTYPNKEIIFINDGSTDGTAKILDEYARQGLIKVIHQENAGKKRALGKGMREARGSIFAFSDSDSSWAPDALEKIVPIFKHFPKVGAVSGHFRLKNSSENILTRIEDSWAEGQFAIRKAFESYYGAVTCVSGPLAVFRKEAIYNYIPAWEQDTFLGQEFKFATDRTLTGYVLGGKYLGKKIKEKYYDPDFDYKEKYKDTDWQIVYSKSARAWTILPNTWKRLFRQQVRWKKSFIRNTFFTGKFYWRKPFLTALVYYAHITFVIFGPIITFRHLIYLPLRGNVMSAILYITGIVFVGLMFGLAYKLENRKCHIWVYRPLMSLLSTLVLSWLIFYSTLTIKKMVWHRG